MFALTLPGRDETVRDKRIVFASDAADRHLAIRACNITAISRRKR